MSSTHPHAAPPSLEARLGARMASALTVRAQHVPHDVSERLRVAREQAVGRARVARAAQAASGTAGIVVGVSARGAALLSAPGGTQGPWWQRAAALLPLLVLVSGLVMIERWAVLEQVQAAADIDALLLSDGLPPTAYSDPGFGEFIRSATPP
jgi:Protein of unknown function (DUF3619)